ncbi:unnamed protein product [Adineta ricciae]|uniref:Uncharacterized protein n=1 Tax=Adineta ricciae TaxID=249248 RepID=A0A814VGQ4_ADIRI|nr:unnamed protein product [Adineta ricciae]
MSANGWRSKSCEIYRCWNEYLTISYPIRNGSEIKSTLTHNHVRECSWNMEIGSSYSCFYQQLRVNLIEWHLPAEQIYFILLFISFFLFGIILISCLFFKWRLVRRKTKSNFSHFIQHDSAVFEQNDQLNSGQSLMD